MFYALNTMFPFLQHFLTFNIWVLSNKSISFILFSISYSLQKYIFSGKIIYFYCILIAKVLFFIDIFFCFSYNQVSHITLKTERITTMGKVIGIYNQKGGSGKTSTSINLSSFLEEMGADILTIDLDSGQCNFTEAFLPEESEDFINQSKMKQLADLLIFEELQAKDAVYPVCILLNSKSKPKHVHIDMIPSFRGEKKKFFSSPYLLKERISELQSEYDYIIMDFPPESPYADIDSGEYNLVSLGLCAANEILVPCSTDTDSLSGFFSLSEHINMVHAEFNPGLYKTSFFINSYNKNFLADREFLEYYETLKPAYSGICIPVSGILKTSRMMKRPLAWYNNNSSVAIAYKELAEYISK